MQPLLRILLILLNVALCAHVVVTTATLGAPSTPLAATLDIRGGPSGPQQLGGIGGFSGGFSGGFNIGFGAIGGFGGVNGFNFGGFNFGGFVGNFGGGIQGGIGGLGGFGFGGFVVTTDHVAVAPRQRLNVSFGWTVPTPGTWRDIETLQLRFTDDAGTVVWLRWDEATNRIRLVRPKTGEPGRGGKPGSARVLRTRGARVQLKRSSVVDAGATGTDVIVNFALRFTGRVAGRTLRTEVLATDDSGASHGFEQVGQVAVEPR